MLLQDLLKPAEFVMTLETKIHFAPSGPARPPRRRLPAFRGDRLASSPMAWCHTQIRVSSKLAAIVGHRWNLQTRGQSFS
jgi:hypothetical protein